MRRCCLKSATSRSIRKSSSDSDSPEGVGSKTSSVCELEPTARSVQCVALPVTEGAASVNTANNRPDGAAQLPRIAVTNRPLSDLQPDPRSPRRHSPRQIRQIAKSIEAFGFNVPILVDAELKVVAGHGRLQACQKLGWTEVPTIQLAHLTEAQSRAFMIADNRLTENSAWIAPIG